MTITGLSTPTGTPARSATPAVIGRRRGRADPSDTSCRSGRAERFRWPARSWGDPGRRPTALRRRRRLGERPRAQDARDLFAVQGLALEERAREGVELLDVFLEDLPRPVGTVEHDALDLGVDHERRCLAVVLLTRDLTAEEDVLLVLAEG